MLIISNENKLRKWFGKTKRMSETYSYDIMHLKKGIVNKLNNNEPLKRRLIPPKPWMHFMLLWYSFAFLAKRNLRVNAYYISGAMPTVYWLPLPRLITNCIRDTVKFSAASLACFHGETAALGRNLLRCFKKPKVRLNCNEVIRIVLEKEWN